MVIVLIRRCVRAEKEQEFLASYKAETPTEKPGFISETLTKLDAAAAELPAMHGLVAKCEGDSCITYVNVAKWNSAADFYAAFTPVPGFYAEAVECEPRVRAVLEIL